MRDIETEVLLFVAWLCGGSATVMVLTSDMSRMDGGMRWSLGAMLAIGFGAAIAALIRGLVEGAEKHRHD